MKRNFYANTLLWLCVSSHRSFFVETVNFLLRFGIAFHEEQYKHCGYVQWGYGPYILRSEFLRTTQTEKYVNRHTFLPKQVTGIQYFADR